jgi:uroporphyrinogen decarboxylase-like protein
MPRDMTDSYRRIVAAYRGGPSDRIPIASPIAWNPRQDIDANAPSGWKARPEFVQVARMVQEHCDPRPPFAPVGRPDVFQGVGYWRFGMAPREFVEKLPAEQVSPTRWRHTTVLHTPQGDLPWSYDKDDDIETQWDLVKPIQSTADVEKMLSVPYRFDPPGAAEFEPFRQHRAELGDLCLGGVGITSMIAMVVGMMSYEMVLEWILTEPGLIKALADAWLERTRERVAYLLDQGVGPVWHFNGVERVCPPMMGPRQWEQLVVAYDGELMRLIKERDPEAIIHVHCHGKVGRLLPVFLEMDVDSTDPVEPPPQGDIEFKDARKLVGDRMTLFGNIEFSDMDMCTPDEIEDKVRRTIDEGGKERTFLCPSSCPHQQHTERFTANAIRYIEAGLKYGAK